MGLVKNLPLSWKGSASPDKGNALLDSLAMVVVWSRGSKLPFLVPRVAATSCRIGNMYHDAISDRIFDRYKPGAPPYERRRRGSNELNNYEYRHVCVTGDPTRSVREVQLDAE